MTTTKKRLADIAEMVVAPEPKPDTRTDISQEFDEADKEISAIKKRLPRGMDARAMYENGWCEFNSRYFFQREKGQVDPISNFVMRVLYRIDGSVSKRIIELTNNRKRAVVVDFLTEHLVSLDKFKVLVESQGNYLFEGKVSDLARIKSKLYDEEKGATEIVTLGQYKQKFWAWANGVFDGKQFLPTDDNGMVEHEEQIFYIPMLASTTSSDDEDLRNYRKFRHFEGGKTTFEAWAKLFCEVYGDNGKVAIAFALFSMFRDIVFEKTRCAPMLFLFGQRGSGKGTLANSLMHLFGVAQDPLMLGGASTVVGFMRKLGQFQNSIVWLDEYKNDIGEKKIESLKNIWDGIGYERGVKDNSNRTQTTPVRATAILSGQEMPNVEPALFSRTMLLEFRNQDFSEASIKKFNDLRTIEQEGLTAAMHEVLALRDDFKTGFEKAFAEFAGQLRAAFAGSETVERQIINWSVICATVAVLEKKLRLPFTAVQLLMLCEKLLRRQATMMKSSNEVQQFFEQLHFLASTKELTEGQDFQIVEGLLKIRLSRIIPLYREHSRRQGLRPMDRGTLMSYLTQSLAFDDDESKKPNHRFRLLQNPTSATVFLHSQIIEKYGVDLRDTYHDETQLIDNQPVTSESSPEKEPQPF